MGDNPNNKKPFEIISEKKTASKAKTLAEKPAYESFPDISNVASAGECTGLMFAPPQSQEEYESYQELSGMEIPKMKEKSKE